MGTRAVQPRAQGIRGENRCTFALETTAANPSKRLLERPHAFLNKLDVDHLVLEFARRGYDELDAFKELKPETKLGVGVVDIKDNEVESTDIIAKRIENAVNVLGMERIKWVHPDCVLDAAA